VMVATLDFFSQMVNGHSFLLFRLIKIRQSPFRKTQ